MKRENIGLIILVIALLFIASQLKMEPFILYGGVEIAGYETQEKGDCWILAEERCVRQSVNLINFTRQNLLVCPEGYYSTEQLCKEKYGLIPRPKINCYYIENDECKVEILEADVCPSQYYPSMEECEKELEESIIYHLKTLFKSPATIIVLIIGIIALLILFVRRK